MFAKSDEKTFRCPKCGTEFATLGFSNRENRMPLYVGCKFYKCEIDPDCDDFLTVAGELVENKLKPGVLGIKNCTEDTWNAKLPDGKFYPIQPGKGFPIWKDLEVDFGKVTARI
jgi:hypothetical protein